MKRVFYIVMISISVWGCSADDAVLPSNNVIPNIRYISITPEIVNQFTDSVIVTFEYEDGDGDLGHKNPDILLLEVQDARLTNPDFYYVPPMAPIGSNIKIKGSMQLRLRNTFLLGSGGDERTQYDIRMKDRAGNWSNYIQTKEITIKK
jgi:hypothetical protein